MAIDLLSVYELRRGSGDISGCLFAARRLLLVIVILELGLRATSFVDENDSAQDGDFCTDSWRERERGGDAQQVRDLEDVGLC